MKMQELRLNPMTGEWVMISSERQERPVLPRPDACPLCPGVLELERDYDLAVFENRFPALVREPANPSDSGSPLLESKASKGICEVVMYTSIHDSSLSRMPLSQIEKLVYVWADRYKELSQYPYVKYVFIFENRGKEVGATLSHPHGQIYAFPFIPIRMNLKLKNMKRYYSDKGACLLCDIVNEEIRLDKRLIYCNDFFIAMVPYYARFPYEVHVIPVRHIGNVAEMNPDEKKGLADILKVVTMKYDKLFDMEFPYMMAMFQTPSDGKDYEYFHFHVEFCPPLRGKNKIKWMASVETETWQFINPSTPEEIADELKRL